MASANEYPRKQNPADTDDVMAVSDPHLPGWSVRRVTVAERSR